MNGNEKYYEEFEVAYGRGDDVGMWLAAIKQTKRTEAEVDREHEEAAIRASIRAAMRTCSMPLICGDC